MFPQALVAVTVYVLIAALTVGVPEITPVEGLRLKQNELKIVVQQFEELQNRLDETI